jgi:hypothetical protein
MSLWLDEWLRAVQVHWNQFRIGEEIKMNTKLHKLACLLALLSVLVLANCSAFGSPLDSKELEKINGQIQESIEKTFPLPEAVFIKTHIANDLCFSTELTMSQTAAFYRDAYAQRGFLEVQGSPVSSNSLSLHFKKEGEKDVLLDATNSRTGSDVHIWLAIP